MSQPDFVWIVKKDSEFGRRLASFSTEEMATYREHIALVCEVDVEIEEDDEPGANYNNSVYFDGPVFIFHIRMRRLGLINNIEEISRVIRPLEPGT